MTPTSHSSSSRSARGAEELWSLIADPSQWPRWNASVAELSLDGEFATGTTGTLTPTGGGRLPFLLVAVDPGSGYTSETTIASTVALRSQLRITADGSDTVVSQSSELVGPAAEHFAPAFGEALVTGVERTVRQLAERA